MSSIVLDRMREQMEANRPKKREIVQESIASPESLPVPPEQLKAMLMEKLNIKSAEVTTPDVELKLPDLYAFSEWYEPRRSLFTETQQIALDTIVKMREGILRGCNCKRQQHDAIGAEYFKKFWDENAKTDMVQAVFKAANVSRIYISNNIKFPE